MTLHILHLTTVHRPFDNRIYHKECTSLSRFFNVALLQRASSHRSPSNVTIYDIPYFSSRLARIIFSPLYCLFFTLSKRPNVVHLHDPELLLIAPALSVLGFKVIYDIHEDLYLDIYAKPWIPSFLRGLASKISLILEHVLSCTCNYYIVATDNIASRFSPDKTSVIRNLPIISSYSSVTRPSFYERESIFLYIGGLGGSTDVKGIKLMLAALSHLPSSSPIKLYLGGPLPYEGYLDELSVLNGYERCIYIGFIDPKDLPLWYAKALGTLILYPPLPNNLRSEPVKLYESMAAGVPTVISNFPHFLSIITRFNCGICCDPYDSKSISKIMLELDSDRTKASSLGNNGLIASRESLCWEKESEFLLGIYKSFLEYD